MEAEERPNKRRRVSEDEALQPMDFGGGASVPAIRRDEVDTEVENTSMTNGELTGQVTKGHDDELKNLQKNGLQASVNGDENAEPTPDKTAPIVDAINIDKVVAPMSKNQQKKVRKDLEWESKRDERKIIRKQKLIAKRERKRAARDEAAANGDFQSRPPGRPHKADLLPVTILIDCDFDDLMRDPERKSLAAQITRSYSDNRKAPFRAHLAVCSFGGHLRERFDNVLMHYKGWKGVRFLDCDFVEAAEQAKEWMLDPQHGGTMAGAFSKFISSADDLEIHSKLRDEAETVYLTSDSDYILTELKPYSTYIIGGLVDKNREKGICYKRATERGIKTAKLPIGEFMDMRSRKVLATNHVNEIMVRWLECGDWGEAFMKVIPKRKGGKLKGAVGEGDAEGSPEQEDEAGIRTMWKTRLGVNTSWKAKPAQPQEESHKSSRATSPAKSVKSTRSTHSKCTASSSGIDSADPASSHANTEQITTAKQYLTLMEALAVVDDVEDHLREKRFYLNQLWQLFSALDKFADEETMEHATQAAQALSNHLSDGVVKVYDQKAAEKGALSLS